MLLLKSFLLTLLIFEVSSVPKYYWRNYNGRIPYDAVVAARTTQGTVYIGRAPFEQVGLLVGPIIKGFRNIIVTHTGKTDTTSVDKLIEILCSPLPHTAFKWVKTTSTALLSKSGMIEGGYEVMGNGIETGVLYIGRAMYQDIFKIGKVVGYYQNENQMYNLFYYSDGKRELWKESFEVLVYEETGSNMMCPRQSQSKLPRDYYWRKYTGNVPQDAVSAGTTGKLPTYIGRVSFENRGSLVAPLVKDAPDIIVTIKSKVSTDTVHNRNTFMEILCSPFPHRFQWVKTPYTTLSGRSDLVQGGFEDAHALYIGRASIGNETIIGKINSFPENRMYYNDDGVENGTYQYEVLTYSERMQSLVSSTVDSVLS